MYFVFSDKMILDKLMKSHSWHEMMQHLLVTPSTQSVDMSGEQLSQRELAFYRLAEEVFIRVFYKKE